MTYRNKFTNKYYGLKDSTGIDYTCTKIKLPQESYIRRNININSITVKEQTYKSLVRPSLEYACSVWDPYTKENITQLKQVQRRAARYATNCYRDTSSVSNMIEHLNWRSLADRRSDARLVMLYKISHELVAILKQTYSYHQLDYPGTCTHSHTKYHQHAYSSDINHSSSEQYENGTVSS